MPIPVELSHDARWLALPRTERRRLLRRLYRRVQRPVLRRARRRRWRLHVPSPRPR